MVNLTALAYGDQCWYKLETRCGYPKVEIVGAQNLELMITYKIEAWNITGPPVDEGLNMTFNQDEAHIIQPSDGKYSWILPSD